MIRILVVLSCFLVMNCAVSYKPISVERPTMVSSVVQDDVEFRVGLITGASNPDIARKMVREDIKFLELEVVNNSNEAVEINYHGLKLVNGHTVITPLYPKEFIDDVDFAVGGYWLYGLIWMGSTSCDNVNGCSSFWLPVGLPIAILNVMKASSSNKKFLDDLSMNMFSQYVVEPGHVRRGMAYFRVRGYNRFSFQIDYEINGVQESTTVNIGL